MALPLLKSDVDSFQTDARTNWVDIAEQRARYGLPGPDYTGPSQLLSLTNSLQLTAIESDGLVLVTGTAVNHTLVALVSASELFTGAAADVELAATEFNMKLAMYQDRHPALSGANARLYIVDTSNWLDSPENVLLGQFIEADSCGVRKFVCRAAELANLLSNPFGKRYTGPAMPKYAVKRASAALYCQPEAVFTETLNYSFLNLHRSYEYVSRLLQHRNADKLVQLANQLIRRAVGSMYEFELNNLAVLANFDGCSYEATPWFCFSKGEQLSMALCAFLAVISDNPEPDTWLSLGDSLNQLDSRHFMQALDVVQDFIAATGINVVIQVDNGAYRAMAETKLQNVAMAV